MLSKCNGLVTIAAYTSSPLELPGYRNNGEDVSAIRQMAEKHVASVDPSTVGSYLGRGPRGSGREYLRPES